MATDGQGTKWRRKIAENFNRLSRVHQRYGYRQTDRQSSDKRQTELRAIAYSEREREREEFTFAKNAALIEPVSIRAACVPRCRA